ncbi:bifunctional nuclease family protein [Synechococcus sp. CS-197]|uniref:bifunctional nuclease family protein n=1 Tax=Synechococcus sp. CS-197 TaxID=2847985 RepID=UPI00223AA4E8|nr:bifunctional nuclease family protein [Synechococcus sp. CS-197]MCT0251341.1 bifunctional nuclease family protein [Synechococcus sp. CS-197]
MSVAGIALDASSRSPIVLLRDPSRRRQVPIWIDQAQAHNIMAGLNGTPQPRPLSHDLMAALLEAGGLQLERVIIHAIEDSTFRAVLRLRHEQDDAQPGAQGAIDTEAESEAECLAEIDARPSDAIALAIRTGSSIWMLEEVVAEASIAVDAEADAEDQDEFRRFLDQVSPAALVRHLKSRDSGNPNDAPTDSPEV